jgi:hypothetical protein
MIACTRRVWMIAAILAAAGALPVAARGDDDRAREAARASEERAMSKWFARVESLTPDAPAEYVVLAEEVHDAAKYARESRLAIELFVIGLHHATLKGETSIASTAALALADINADPFARRSLRDFARTLEPRLVRASWTEPRTASNAGSTDYQVAVAIGNARAGYGTFARQALRRPEVSERLLSLSPTLSAAGLSGGREWIEQKAKGSPCPECSNSRLTRRSGERRLCSSCKGLPGPELGLQEYLASLRVELLLLRADESEWSRQLSIDTGMPLRVMDSIAAARLFLVDPSKPYLRAGKWWTNADGTDPKREGAAESSPQGPPPLSESTTSTSPSSPQPAVPNNTPPLSPPIDPSLNPQPQPLPTLPIPQVPSPQPRNPSEDPLPGEDPTLIPTMPPK